MTDMTCKQAGKLGGQATRDRYGTEHMRAIGRRGGTSPKRDPVATRAAAAKGGAVTRARYDHDQFAEWGRKGGQITARRGKDYYAAIGRKGGRGKGPAVGATYPGAER